MKEIIATHAHAIYWFAIIQVVRAFTRLGAVEAAEWIARETGLRARVVALLSGTEHGFSVGGLTMKEIIVTEARGLYWLAVIKAVRVLTFLGAVDAAEWISRETGLRARVIALLYGPDRTHE